MPTTRSAQLALATFSGTGTHNVYTAPAGKRVILKSASVQNRSTTPGKLYLQVQGIGSVAQFFTSPDLAQYADAYETFWIVLKPGDVLQVVSPTATSFSVMASGAELVLDP